MLALIAIPLAALSLSASIQPLPPSLKSDLDGRYWHTGCPVPMSGLRLLTVKHWGFDGKRHRGSLVVNAKAAAPLERVFAKLFSLRFPIRHLDATELYGPPGGLPAHGDLSGSFECRQAVPSPCSKGTATGTGHWSNHAYGLAIDLNPTENPYVGCGSSRNKASLPYLDRTRVRKGMVTPAVVAAFRSIGWGWGGSWSGDTKDYMHFSHNGH